MVLDIKAKELKYYKDPKDTKPKGVISLINATLYAHVEKKGKEMEGYFNLRMNDRDFLMRVEDPSEKSDWVKSIKESIVTDPSHISPKQRKGLLSKQSSFLGVVKNS